MEYDGQIITRFLYLKFQQRDEGGDNSERISEWFDLSHEWIVKAFADVTNSEIQKKYGEDNKVN